MFRVSPIFKAFFRFFRANPEHRQLETPEVRRLARDGACPQGRDRGGRGAGEASLRRRAKGGNGQHGEVPFRGEKGWRKNL